LTVWGRRPLKDVVDDVFADGEAGAGGDGLAEAAV
jgi:hypothetical protein